MSNQPDDPPADESDPRDGAGSASSDGPRKNPAGSGEAAPGSGLGNLEDKFKADGGRPSGGGSFPWSCGGCVLLVIVTAAVGTGLFYPTSPVRLLPGGLDPSGSVEAAREVFTVDLPGETRGIGHLRVGLEVALLENERDRAVLRVAVFQFPGGWPEWIRVISLRVMEAYWRWLEGFSPGEYDADRRMLCGRTIRVESASERTDKGVRAVRRRACVRHQGDVRCVLVLGLGHDPESSTRDLVDSLDCP